MSLLKAGGGNDRKVVRHRVRSASTPSDRTRSISASIASQSNKGARHGGHATLRAGRPLRFGGISLAMTR
jgi:hypothetical protein